MRIHRRNYTVPFATCPRDWYNNRVVPRARAINSAGECHLHTVEVAGSIPASPIKKSCFLSGFRQKTLINKGFAEKTHTLQMP